ncbi:MAG: hypothetical protein WD992_02855 [Candidatus Levyibacteriota bacterium]
MTYKSLQKSLMDKLEKDAGKSSTIVTMLSDYANDNQISLALVYFLPKALTEKIYAKLINPLEKADSQQYYYLKQSLHITIQPIRVIHSPPNFTVEDIEKVRVSFSKIIPKLFTINFSLEGLLKLPTSLALRAYADVNLGKLILALEKVLSEIGVPNDKKYLSGKVFWGNSTLCRYTSLPNEAFLRTIEKLKDVKLGLLKVESVSLITTNPVVAPDKTQIIETYHLKP